MSKAVIMGIALASNIGGMLSPIASPQNVVAMGIMTPAPTWPQWFFIVIPVGVVSILLIWLLLLVTFKPSQGTSIAPIRSMRERTTATQIFVMVVTLITIGLWCASKSLESVFGDMGVIALIPIVLFFGTGILTKEDFNNFPWTIIILAAGGLALGKAVDSSGLLHTIAGLVSARVQNMSLYGVLVIFSCLILVIATFISHTVAALIILPLVFNVGKDMDPPNPNVLVMAGVLMCSAAMALPTSGFPNMSQSCPSSVLTVPALSIQKLTPFDSGHHEGGPSRSAVPPSEALHQPRHPEQSYHPRRCCHDRVRRHEGYGPGLNVLETHLLRHLEDAGKHQNILIRRIFWGYWFLGNLHCHE